MWFICFCQIFLHTIVMAVTRNSSARYKNIFTEAPKKSPVKPIVQAESGKASDEWVYKRDLTTPMHKNKREDSSVKQHQLNEHSSRAPCSCCPLPFSVPNINIQLMCYIDHTKSWWHWRTTFRQLSVWSIVLKHLTKFHTSTFYIN